MLTCIHTRTQTTCVKLGMCKTTEKISFQNATNAYKNAAPDVQCKLCKKATAWLDENVFESPEAEAKMAADLKQTCVKLADKGKPVELKCEQLIDEDTPQLMHVIGKAVADELCADIGACAK